MCCSCLSCCTAAGKGRDVCECVWVAGHTGVRSRVKAAHPRLPRAFSLLERDSWQVDQSHLSNLQRVRPAIVPLAPAPAPAPAPPSAPAPASAPCPCQRLSPMPLSSALPLPPAPTCGHVPVPCFCLLHPSVVSSPACTCAVLCIAGLTILFEIS